MRIQLQYRLLSYQHADELHPDPYFGKRVFNLAPERFSTDSFDAIQEIAEATAPENYRLFSIRTLPAGPSYTAKPWWEVPATSVA